MGLLLFVGTMVLFVWWGRERRAFLRAPQPVRLAALAQAIKGAAQGDQLTGQFAGRAVEAALLMSPPLAGSAVLQATPPASGSAAYQPSPPGESAAAQEGAGRPWRTAIPLPEGPAFRLHWAIDSALGRRAPVLTAPEAIDLAPLLRWAELEPLLADGETVLVGEAGRLCVLEFLPGDGLPTPERLLAHLDLLDRAADVVINKGTG